MKYLHVFIVLYKAKHQRLTNGAGMNSSEDGSGDGGGGGGDGGDGGGGGGDGGGSSNGSGGDWA